MSDLDDIEEINLSADREGSAKRSRAGRRLALAKLRQIMKTPKWKRQLSRYNSTRKERT